MSEMICWEAEIILCCAGGVHAVAKPLGWRTQRRHRHSSASLEEAAELVREYLQMLPRGSPARKRMPSNTELMKCGRHDVRYAMQVRSTDNVLSLGHCGVQLPPLQPLLACACMAGPCMCPCQQMLLQHSLCARGAVQMASGEDGKYAQESVHTAQGLGAHAHG